MRFPIANNRSDEIAGWLPLKSSGFGWAIQNYTTQVFTLDPKDKRCPRNWRDLIESGVNYTVPLRDDADPSDRMTGYFITSHSESGDGLIKIQTSSWERVYENFVLAGPRFDLKDATSEVFPSIGGTVNQDGVGCNMTFDCAPSGRLINKYISAGDRLSPREVMDDIASDFEWTTDVVWDNEEHTKFRKVTRTGYPHLSTATTTPEIAFTRDINGKGNILDYSFTDSRREGDYATYVVATGSGVDDDQIESAPVIDTEAEQVEMRMRVMKFENFSGVTTVAEANVMAQRMADNYFAKRNVITLKVSTTGAVKPSQIEKGAFVRLDLWTKAGNRIDEIWRVIALKESSDGKYYEPTLAKIGVQPADFPRPADVSEIGRAIREVNRRVDRITNRNPSINGVRMRDARINRDGSIERRTPNGGWEAAGAGVTEGTVTSYDAQARTAVVTLASGSSRTVINGERDALHAGDTVWVAGNTDRDSMPVIVAAPHITNVSSDVFGPYGASPNYPIDAAAEVRTLPYGATFKDVDNVSGFGIDAVLIDSPDDFNVFLPGSGGRESIKTPSGYVWVPGMIRISENKMFQFFSKDGDPNSPVWLFAWNPSTRGWMECSGLPVFVDTHTNTYAGGVWSANSAGVEMLAPPCVVVLKVRQAQFVGSTVLGWHVPLTAMVYTWNAIAATWNITSMDIESGKLWGWNSSDSPTFRSDVAIIQATWGINAGSHVFYRAALLSTSTSGDTENELRYFNTVSGANEVVATNRDYLGSGDPGSVREYVGASSTGSSFVRLSVDGQMYCGTPAIREYQYGTMVITDATLKYRNLNSSSIKTSIVQPANMDANTPVGILAPQRVWNSDRYILTSQIYSDDQGTVRGRRGAIWDHWANAGTSFQIVAPDPVLTGSRNAIVSMPVQAADGAVIANLDISNAEAVGSQGPSHAIHQVVI